MFEIFENTESEVRSYCRKYPVEFSTAKNAEMFSREGERYIDFLAGAGALNYGHNNPEIKSAVMEYLSRDSIIHALDMYTEAKEDFLTVFKKDILEPRGLDYKVMFCGSTGTNAVEAALKLARKNTGRTNVITFSGAFHGMTLGSLAMTTDQTSRQGAGVPLTNVTFVPYGDTMGIEYLKWLLEDDHSGIDKPAAVFLETIQAEGGINVAPVEWLRELRELCTEHGILMVADDIQVGCGRTGYFFSFERADIVPDMVVLSKSISGFGLPMSLLLMRPELDIFKPAEHNGTFRGNQLAFVGAAAAIRYYNAHDLGAAVQKKGALVEAYLKDAICALDERISCRGMGLIWGIDMSGIDKAMAVKVMRACVKRHMIIEVAGRGDSVLKILCPLTIPEDILKEGLDIIRDAIVEVLKEYK